MATGAPTPSPMPWSPTRPVTSSSLAASGTDLPEWRGTAPPTARILPIPQHDRREQEWWS